MTWTRGCSLAVSISGAGWGTSNISLNTVEATARMPFTTWKSAPLEERMIRSAEGESTKGGLGVGLGRASAAGCGIGFVSSPNLGANATPAGN